MSDSDNSRDRILKAAFDCRSELVAYAWSLLGNLAAAEDAVQEAMLVVVKKHDQFEEGTSVLAWCRAMVRIEVLRARQLHGKERSLVERLLDDAVDAAFEEFQTTSDHHQNGLRLNACRPYLSVNHVASHDGFTMYDLVSYDRRQSWATKYSRPKRLQLEVRAGRRRRNL